MIRDSGVINLCPQTTKNRLRKPQGRKKPSYPPSTYPLVGTFLKLFFRLISILIFILHLKHVKKSELRTRVFS